MMKQGLRMRCRRITSGFLAFTMTAILVLGDAGAAFASTDGNKFFKDGSDLGGDGYSVATSSNASFKNHSEDEVVMSIFSSDDSDFRAGGTVFLDVHLKNETGTTITEGVLDFTGKKLRESGAYFEEPEEDDVVSEGIIEAGGDLEDDEAGAGSQTMELENDLADEKTFQESDAQDDGDAKDNAIEAGESGQKETGEAEEEEEEEEDDEPLQKIEGIELAPGQIYTARFVFEVDDSIEKAKNMHVNFRFRGETEEKKINKQEKFEYVANYLNIGEIRFEDGNEVKTGETVTMGIHTTMFDFDSLLTNKKVEDELLASASNAAKASPSNGLASASNAQAATYADTDDEAWTDEDEDNDDFVVDLGKVKYEIQMTNAKLNGFEVRDALVSDANENMMVCTFRVSQNVKPGVYFGKVFQKMKGKMRTYSSSQGFALIVSGDGDVTLETKVEGSDAVVTVSGPVDSFPDADQLAVAAKEITVATDEISADSEKMEQVHNAIEKKAQEENIDVKAFKALDIKLYADGQEVEPTGPIRVAFKNVKLEDKLASAEAAEVEETAEIAEEESKNPIAKLFEVFSADDVKAEEVVTVEEAVAKAAEENSESKVEVWHLPDESEEIGQTFEVSTDEETGDVVMDTDHFSIYIVVNTGLGGKDLKVHVEHWIDYYTIDGDATDASHICLDETADANGRRYGFYTKDDIYNRHTQTIDKKNHYTGKLYTPDEFLLPNGLEDQTIEGLSKVCLEKENKQWANKNYWISEVWISNKTSNLDKPTWSGAVEKYVITRNEKTGNIVSVKDASGKNLGVNPKVTLTKDSVVRFWYKEKVVSEKYKQPVTFWDHNVGGSVSGGHNVGQDQGTNSERNFPGNGKWKMGAGQPVSGNASSWASGNMSPLGHLNKGSTPNQAQGIITDSNIAGSKGRDYVNGYVIIKNEVKSTLNGNNLQYNANIQQPGFFQQTKSGNTFLTKQIDNYNLGFKQEGDTYTLSTVYKGNGSEVSSIGNLEEVKYSAHNSGSDTNIYSNEFWPLDDVANYEGKDSKGSGSDDGKAHNWHFAMRYDFGFKVGDYEGPINYYFRGDDDFWLFVDGKKVIDLGGIHSAVGEAVDLRKVVDLSDREKEHKVSVFYMERGGYGSCCYMQFTIPNCSKTWPIPTVDKTEASVKKEWEDDNSPVRPTSIDVQLVRREKRNNTLSSTVVVLDEKTLPQNGKWEYTWDNLPVENVNNPSIKYQYEVREKGTPKGYIKSESTTNTITKIINKLEPVKVNVTKTWNDDNDRDGNRPDKLSLELWWSKDSGKTWAAYPDDSKAKVEVDVDKDSNSHTYTFSNLPKYSGNTEIQYRVYEKNGESRLESTGATLTGKNNKNYTLDEIKFDQTDNGDVTASTSLKNIYVPETVERTVVKKWVDVPESMESSIEVGLYEQGRAELFQWEGGWNRPNNWQNPVTLKKDKNSSVKTATYTWTKLPKYRDHGTLIKYEVYERDKGQKIESSGIHTFDGYNYKVEPGKQITYSEDKGTVTVTNTLIKAKLRVVKFTEKNNLDKEGNEIDQKYKFLINVTEVNDGTESDYASLTLGQREDPEQYIEVIPTAAGKTFKIEEVVPMEYELVRMIGMATSEWKNKATGTWVVDASWQSNLQGFDGTAKAPSVKLMPGDDITITVVNRPDHEGYFHHTYSVTNENQAGSGFQQIETTKYDEPHGNGEADTTAPTSPVAWLPTRDSGRRFGEEESLEGDEDLYA